MSHKYVPGIASDRCQFRTGPMDSCLRPESEHCTHEGTMRTLGFDKQMNPTGRYCQNCGKVWRGEG